MTESDDALIARHRAGDAAAFSELVQRHQRAVYFFARRMTGSDEDARDLTQRAFLRAFKALDRFEGRAAFSTWMHQIIANLCRNHHRDTSRVSFVEVDEATAQQPATVVGAMMKGEERARLQEAVERLPPRQQAVLKARVFEDLSFKEIAAREGISAGNARVSYHHAVTALRGSMASEIKEVSP